MKMLQSPFASMLYLLMLVSSPFNVHYIPPSSCPTGARTTPHVTVQQKYMSSRHISSSCHPHFSLFASSPLFSLYLTLTSCYLAVTTSCNNCSSRFAIIRCLITTAQLPCHAAMSHLTVATSSCFLCFALLGLTFISSHIALPLITRQIQLCRFHSSFVWIYTLDSMLCSG
jgi:hypothetical protein